MGQRVLRLGSGWDRQPRDVELRLLNEEFGFIHFLRLGDLPAGRHHAEGVLLGCQRRGGNHPPCQGQRVSRLPCKWLSKAGGDQEESFGQPHDKY